MSKVSVNMSQLTKEVSKAKGSVKGLQSIKTTTAPAGLDVQAAKKFVSGFKELSTALSDYASVAGADGDRLQALGKNQQALDKQVSR